MPDWNEYGNIRSPSRNRLLFPEHKLTTEVFVDYFKGLNTNLWILDAGCGDGFWMEVLRNLGFSNLIGVDLSYSLLKRAKGKGFNVIQSSVASLKFQRKFDVIIMCDVLEHLHDAGITLSNLRDVLKESGILYLVIPVYDSLSSRFQRFFHRKTKIDQAREHDETHVHAFSKDEIFKLLRANNFQVKRAIYTANRLPMVSGKIQRFTFANMFGNWLSITAKINVE